MSIDDFYDAYVDAYCSAGSTADLSYVCAKPQKGPLYDVLRSCSTYDAVAATTCVEQTR